jgi:hypothetical protein
MTRGYSEGFNMSEVMECRSKRPVFLRYSQTITKSENQMLLLHSVDTPISPRKKSPNKEINKPNYSYYFEQTNNLEEYHRQIIQPVMYQEINDSEAISPKKNTLSIMNEVKPRVMKFFIL